MRLSAKLYKMQMGGYNPYQHLTNIPLTVGLGYGQGLEIGRGLGFNERSQKDLGKLSALNSGLNATAGFINSISRQKEEQLRLERERDSNYYNVPQDRYRYADYSNSPRQASFFQNGGEMLPEFTVVANRKGGKQDREIEFLAEAQNFGNKSSLYQMWLKAGQPNIRTFLGAKTGSFEFDVNLNKNGNLSVNDKGTLNLPKLGKHTLTDLNNNAKEQLSGRFAKNGILPETDLGLDQFLTELPHAQQFNNTNHKLDHVLRSNNEIESFGGKEVYNINGSIENNAHDIIEPQLRNQYNNNPDYSTRVQFFQNGGQIPVSNNGLYQYPNQPVIVPSNNITMDGINHDVLAIPDNDKPRIMKPNKQYTFANSNRVLEYPIL